VSAAPLRVLFLCTGNSARSQMAEALLNARGQGRIHAESGGTNPATAVNPLALETLQAHGIPWSGRPPRGVDAIVATDWDVVVTVCDRAKESCPVFPGHPRLLHWSLPDPHDRADFETVFGTLEKAINTLL